MARSLDKEKASTSDSVTGRAPARARSVARFPLLSVLYLSAWHLIAVLPLFLSQTTIPVFFFDLTHRFRSAAAPFAVLLGLLLSINIFIVCLCLFIRRMRLPSVAIFIGLFLLQFLNLTSVIYFANVRTWLNASIVADFYTWIGQAIGYLTTALSPTQWLGIGALSVVNFGICFRITRQISACAPKRIRRFSVVALLSFGCFAASLGTLYLHRTELLFRRMTRESLPLASTVTAIFQLIPDNSFQPVLGYLPGKSSNIAPKPLAEDAQPKNVVLVLMDSLRADHTPFYGYERETMPKLAADSAILPFARAYSHVPTTEPSLRTLFNSRYFAGFSRWEAGSADFWQSLRQRGIHSSFITSTYLEPSSAFGRALGFSGLEFFASPATNPSDTRRKIQAETLPNQFFYDDEFSIDLFAQFLQHVPTGERFFSVLFLQSVHYPYPAGEFEGHYSPTSARLPNPWERNDLDVTRIGNAYDNSVLHADALFVQVLDLLRTRGDLEKSLVIFSADHGESVGERGFFLHARHFYDEQIRVPLLFRIGTDLPQLREALEMQAKARVVGLIDLLPTFADLLNLPQSSSWEGRSIFADTPKPYELFLFAGPNNLLGVLKDDVKSVYNLDTSETVSYNLAADPKELQSLWHTDVHSTREFLAAVFGGEKK